MLQVKNRTETEEGDRVTSSRTVLEPIVGEESIWYSLFRMIRAKRPTKYLGGSNLSLPFRPDGISSFPALGPPLLRREGSTFVATFVGRLGRPLVLHLPDHVDPESPLHKSNPKSSRRRCVPASPAWSSLASPIRRTVRRRIQFPEVSAFPALPCRAVQPWAEGRWRGRACCATPSSSRVGLEARRWRRGRRND